MSDSEPQINPLTAPVADSPASPAVSAGGTPRRWVLLIALVAVAALLLGILLWQKLSSIQEELAARTPRRSPSRRVPWRARHRRLRGN